MKTKQQELRAPQIGFDPRRAFTRRWILRYRERKESRELIVGILTFIKYDDCFKDIFLCLNIVTDKH